MDLGALLLLIALLLGVGLYLAAPLMRNHARGATSETREVSSLLAEHERLISTLQELDFDFRLGKIPEEDYPDQRAELLQKGANILRRLDVLAPGSKAAASRRSDAAGQAGRLTDEKIESMLAARRKGRKTKSAGFCPRCGKPSLVSDQFCSNCGRALR